MKNENRIGKLVEEKHQLQQKHVYIHQNFHTCMNVYECVGPSPSPVHKTFSNIYIVYGDMYIVYGDMYIVYGDMYIVYGGVCYTCSG